MRNVINAKRTPREWLPTECLSSVTSHGHLTTPINRQLLDQVAGAGATEKDYIYGGFGSSVGIRAALRAIGSRLSEYNRILDFGCGSARILRWFADVSKESHLYGCDINETAIRWCKENITFAQFEVNQPWPPLPYAENAFDLIYGISVLTHLNEEMQLAWLDELCRVTRSGGIVLLTVHGDSKAGGDLSPEEHNQFKQCGFLYKAATVKATVDGLPDFYQVAFHSEEYVRRVWSNKFEILGYVTHGCMYSQDLVVMRSKKRDAGKIQTPVAGNTTIDERTRPLVAFDTPIIGTTVDTSRLDPDLEFVGWAFHPSGEAVEVEVWIDGEWLRSCIPSLPSPHVAAAFPMFSTAVSCAYSLTFPSDKLEKGWHTAWLTLKDDTIPLWAIFFRYGKSRRRRTIGRLAWRLRCVVRLRSRIRSLFGGANRRSTGQCHGRKMGLAAPRTARTTARPKLEPRTKAGLAKNSGRPYWLYLIATANALYRVLFGFACPPKI